MTSVPDDNAASRPGDAGSAETGPLSLPFTPSDSARPGPFATGATVVGGVAVLAGAVAGPWALLLVTLGLVLVLAWGWPSLVGSTTPSATSVILAVSGTAIVLTALGDDLRWVAGAVALGIILSFFGQLVRPPTRDGLVLTLLGSFGGLVLMASGTLATVAADDDRGAALVAVAMAGVVAAVGADLVGGVGRSAGRGPLVQGAVTLGVALVVSLVVALVLDTPADGLGVGLALGLGAVTGLVSWALRRVLSPEPGMATARGQAASAAGSVLVVGALVHLVAITT
jgi:hypothetical protein